MIKHVVMWRLKEEALGRTKMENALLIKSDLEALKGQIEEILTIEVGINCVSADQAFDLVLVSTFESLEALDRYQVHPLHKKVGELIGAVRTERVVVDYEVASAGQ